MLISGQEEQVCDATEAEISATVGFQTKTAKEAYKKYLCGKFFNTCRHLKRWVLMLG